VIRIVITGSECTGKTTLAEALAARLEVAWVREFARAYAAGLGRPLEYADVDAIARGQIAAEDAVVGSLPAGVPADRPLVIQDTDLLSTVVYSRHYYEDCPAWIEAEAGRRRADLYLLAGIDVPWVPDGNQRDRGDLREEMQRLFREALHAHGAPFVALAGSLDDRLEAALAAVRALVRQHPDSN